MGLILSNCPRGRSLNGGPGPRRDGLGDRGAVRAETPGSVFICVYGGDV